jgi:alanyl-tRNA synthetase
MAKKMSGAEIRQSYIDFFKEKGHTFVPSSSLVPGGDQTLLFTNAGMVQYKDVFLGIDNRPYTRAVNSQKCMRVAGKHNDLDDVGRDNSHHTFFEMLGNWSFGDYYKKEAIAWAWELLTKEWGINPDLLYFTCFKDDEGDLPTDTEASEEWAKQPGADPSHILFFGRKDNFWEMADTGPCGPCSEINIDRGAKYCNKKEVPGHVCAVNGDCARFLEIWNLVFIQYNRVNKTQFDPLPHKHVDTGMGFDRIVSVLQNVDSNYRTDQLFPLIEKVQELAGHSSDQVEANFTPYRVVADHTRAAAFLIADGVVPGNIGRNYICRMIIRRAARFGSKIGLSDPFLAKVAEVMIGVYGEAFPELLKNKLTILENLTREEKRFARTVESGVGYLDEMLEEMKKSGEKTLDGKLAFELYATHGLPLELTRDIARENGLDVDEPGFKKAMDEHRIQSGAGKAFGNQGGEGVEIYKNALKKLTEGKKLSDSGVDYNPYDWLSIDGELLALFSEGVSIASAEVDSVVEVIVPRTGFYIESGGQVADTGWIQAQDGSWEVEVSEVKRPAAGVIIHSGIVTRGTPHLGDSVRVVVDQNRRMDIMRNHTATHLLHAQLHKIIGEHARQAGSLVAPDRLRFDLTHHEAITPDLLMQIEAGVNKAILEDHPLAIKTKSLNEAMAEGATALFGEKYGEEVRTVTIDAEKPISYELCGGTHVENTGAIGTFLIISEGSAAAGVRRIEAVTGKAAYEVIRERTMVLRKASRLLNVGLDDLTSKITTILDTESDLKEQVISLQGKQSQAEFKGKLDSAMMVSGIPVLVTSVTEASMDSLRQMTDTFREKYTSGIIAVGTVNQEKPAIICAVTEDLIQKYGINAGELVRTAAVTMDGSGGGRPNLAQAGGKTPGKLAEALGVILGLIETKIQ